MLASSAVRRRLQWAYACGVFILAALLVWSLAAVPYLPTNDGPEHVAASHIEEHFSDPGTFYADALRPTTEFAAHGFGLIYGPLLALFGWRVGLTVALAIMALGVAGGFASLVHALHPGRWPVVFLGFPLALMWELYMGFFPFVVGSAVGLFALALAVRWRDPTSLQRAALGTVLLAQAICHAFSAVLTGVVVAALLVTRCASARGARAALLELGRVVIMGLPAASVLGASVVLADSANFPAEARAYVFLPLLQSLFIIPRLLAPGPWWRTIMVVCVVVAGIVAGASRVVGRRAQPSDAALFVSGVVFVVAGVFLPLHVPGWQYCSPRFLPLGALLCIATLPVEDLPRPRDAALVAAGLFAVASACLVESVALHRRLAAACADAIAGLSAPVQRHAFWLPITLNADGGLPPYAAASEVPFLQPLLHLPMLYAVVEGGLPPQTFAYSGATYPFVMRSGLGFLPPTPPFAEIADVVQSDRFGVDLPLRRRVVDELARFGMRFEGVLVTEARPEDLRVLANRGYEADWHRGSVFIGHFVPCPLDVVIPAEGDVPRIDLELGDPEALPTVLRYLPQPPLDGPEGHRHLTMPDAPCGEVRVRPHWDSKREGTLTRTYCGNAPTGAIATTLTRTPSQVTCEAPTASQ
jgi:hypothetical protein